MDRLLSGNAYRIAGSLVKIFGINGLMRFRINFRILYVRVIVRVHAHSAYQFVNPFAAAVNYCHRTCPEEDLIYLLPLIEKRRLNSLPCDRSQAIL